jgi:hypothetical protein
MHEEKVKVGAKVLMVELNSLLRDKNPGQRILIMAEGMLTGAQS